MTDKQAQTADERLIEHMQRLIARPNVIVLLLLFLCGGFIFWFGGYVLGLLWSFFKGGFSWADATEYQVKQAFYEARHGE